MTEVETTPETVVERYLALRDPIEPVDALLVFGTFDDAVAVHAARLLSADVAPRAVLTGGRSGLTAGAHASEASRFATIAAELGVDRSRLVIDEQATNTRENVVRALACLPELDAAGRAWGLVGRELQARRCLLTFRAHARAAGRAYPAPGTLRHALYGSDRDYGLRLAEEVDRIVRYGRSGDLAAEQVPDAVQQAVEALRGAV